MSSSLEIICRGWEPHLVQCPESEDFDSHVVGLHNCGFNQPIDPRLLKAKKVLHT